MRARQGEGGAGPGQRLAGWLLAVEPAAAAAAAGGWPSVYRVGEDEAAAMLPPR